MEFAVVILGSKLLPGDLAIQVAAVDAQARNEFLEAWSEAKWSAAGFDYRIGDGDRHWPVVAQASTDGLPPATFYEVDVMDSVPEGELGDHDPLSARVKPSLNDPLDARVLGHEVLEARGDITCAGMVPGGSAMMATEACDPVEDYWYQVPVSLFGSTRWVKVPNFVLPAWFNPAAPPPYDYMGLVKAPLQILPGGYALTEKNGQIQGIYADGAGRLKMMGKLAQPQSRTARRFAAARRGPRP